MDFAMKDFDLQTGVSTVNVQHKKPFDIADVDNNAMKFEVITNNFKGKKTNSKILLC